MGKLRTANKRHKRALVLAIETRRRAATTPVETVAPVQTDR